MSDEMTATSTARSFGRFLKSLREGQDMSLRDVEGATDKDVSNAYLSQLENGKIAKPSPHILHALSTVYSVAYTTLMERAGYISVSTSKVGKKHGKAATFAIENLTPDEESELLEYLSFIRAKKKGKS